MTIGFEIIILLAVAVILLVRLIGVLGRRDGFEPENRPVERPRPANDLRLVSNNDDLDVEQFDSDESIKTALQAARKAEPGFSVDEFLHGAKAAYEMILMGFLKGDMSDSAPFIDPHVLKGFEAAIKAREEAGERVEAEFIGIKNIALSAAEYDAKTKELVLTVDYEAELTQQVYDAKGKLISGSKNKAETELDSWQYSRIMGSNDLNWTLIATGE